VFFAQKMKVFQTQKFPFLLAFISTIFLLGCNLLKPVNVSKRKK